MRRDRAGCAAIRARAASSLNLAIAFLPAALLGLAVRRADQVARCSRRCRSRSRSSPARSSSCGPSAGSARGPARVRIADVDDMRWTRRAEGRLRAGVRADPRHVALGRDDHRRHAVRAVAQGGHRVLVLPRGSDAGRRGRLLAVEGPRTCCRPPTCRRSASASPRRSCRRSLCIRWLIRYVSRHDFVPFAWYRIAFGAVILVTAWTRPRPLGSDATRRRREARWIGPGCARSSARSASRSRRS